MEHLAEDYYDLPFDLLPSANFAGRPPSDISMLDGLWTLIISSSSSSSENGDESNDDGGSEGGSTPQPQNTSPTSSSTHTQPETPRTPNSVPTSPSTVDLRPRMSSLSDDVKILERPPSRKKLRRASADVLHTPSPSSLKRIKSSDVSWSPSDGVTKVKVDMEQATECSLAAKEIPYSDKMGPQRPLPNPPYYNPEAIPYGTQPFLGSFSTKARVKATLKQKNLGTLDTALADYNSRRMPMSPSSMLATPRELYAIPEQYAAAELLPSPRSSYSWRKSLVQPKSPRACSPSVCSALRIRDQLQRANTITTTSTASCQRTYLPGVITLEQLPALPRKDSVATMHPFDYGSKLESEGRRFSDLIVLDGIVVFFEDFSVVADVTEVTLDKYWLEEDYQNDYETIDVIEIADASTSSESITGMTLPKGQRNSGGARESKFSFSSASSASAAPAGTAKRRRNRLRGLLSPGLPGSAFLKSSTSWGQLIEKSQSAAK